jgi:hypothetical protein
MKHLATIISGLLASAVPLIAADAPITSLTTLTTPAGGDKTVIVDISDTTQSANGTTKQITLDNLGTQWISDGILVGGTSFDGVTTIAPSKNVLRDYVILHDTDLDGKVDVLDLAAAGFVAVNSSGVVTAARSVAEGASIDVTNGDGSAGNPTVAFDSTETEATTWGAGGNASNIWTFNLTGTDPVITFSSGAVNVSTGTLQQGGVDVLTTSGTATLTNKTLDGSATGNVLKFKSLPQFTSPLRVDGTGCTIGTTSTSVGYGLGSFSNSADQASNWMEFRIIVPQDWDTGVDPTLKIIDMIGADTGTRRYVFGYASAAASASATPGLSAINVDMAADASGANGDIEISGTTTLTGMGAGVTPGQLLVIRIARDGDAPTVDTSTVNSTVLSVELAYGATQ